jgi:hypothetical protein
MFFSEKIACFDKKLQQFMLKKTSRRKSPCFANGWEKAVVIRTPENKGHGFTL